jgi:fibronectin-binding autotransporter adhesin
MAQTYTRQSTFADGDTITAALFNDEYNQLVNAFAYSSTSATTTGHRHDGTAGQGGNIPKIGDLDFLNKIEVDSTNNRWGFYVEVSSAAVEQIRIQDGAIVPVTDNDIDLGSSSLEFKDLYIDGTATIDTLTVDEAATIGTTLGVTGATTLSSTLAVTGAATLSSTLAVTGTSTLTGNVTTTNDLSVGGNLTVTGNATISGNLTFGDADTDSITLTADVASNITPDTDDTYDLGSSTKEWRDIYIDGTAYLDAINFNGTAITATAAELNIMDGVTSTASELNLVDGSSAGTIVNSKAVIYGSAGEVNATTLQVGGVSITSTPAELNILDGVTATTAELNYTDGVTSNIQTQLDAKQSLDADLTAIAALSNTDGNFIVGNGTTWVAESGATARASLGLTISSDVLAYDANLQSFVTAFTLPTSDGTSGQALITNGSGTISFGDVDSLPSQTGNSGYYLTTDGTNASWDNLKASPTFTGTVTISSTDALTLPVGTTAQRPTAAQGMIRYNTTTSGFEGYNGSAWSSLGAQFAYTRTSATATASQTTFSATYTAGYVDVYLNGVKLVSGTDFTATNGTSVVLTTGATVGDSVEILAYETFAVANALIASNNLSDLSSASTALTNLGITSTAAELNILDGVTATTAEINYVDGVTSNIQTQLDTKAGTGKAIAMAIVFG